MDTQSPVLVVISSEDERPLGNQLANLLGYSFANVVVGNGYDAARFIDANRYTPKYIAMFTGERSQEVFAELEEMSEHCVSGTQVVVIGQVNDIKYYRALIERGIAEYFTYPPNMEEVSRALIGASSSSSNTNSSAIAFMSAAAGDGSSTVALNAAYCLAREFRAKTIVVDMDYQFGMVCKNLDLGSPYGIKELFEHPDRGIDSTLIKRMAVQYNDYLDLIAAPNELKYLPDLNPEMIRDLLLALKSEYRYVILDLPHIWSPWISAAFSNSDSIILVAQLWLKSVTHASRLLNVWREIGIDLGHVDVIINRSGAKFKEGVSARDFERVCNKKISFHLPNDIKTVVNAENMGKTIIEVGKSKLATGMMEVAQSIENGGSFTENQAHL
ncbi:MAG: AAA family ATPase [Rickettsiales bacterium]|nr:AAA family ATPase [Rickettsiales bacterium]